MNMSTKVRVGVIGTSWWADMMHLPALKSHPRAEVAAVCGRNRDRAEEMAKKYEIPTVFTDYREMIEKGNLQAIVIATPDDMHYPMVMNALDAGLHVVCEKPLASNVEQAREMCDKAEDVGVKHMIYFTYRWVPVYRYVRELIDEGYIGCCFHCHIHNFLGYSRGPSGWLFGDLSRWRFDGKRSNGVLGDLGSHAIDLALWYVGDIAKVNAFLASFVYSPETEDQNPDLANNSAPLAVEFVNGAQGIIHSSAVAHVGSQGFQQSIILHGDSGVLESSFSFTGASLRGMRNDEQEFRTLSIPDHILEGMDATQPIFGQLVEVFTKQSVGDRLFIDAILRDGPVFPTFHEGLKAQEVIDAAIASHQSGSWVSLQ